MEDLKSQKTLSKVAMLAKRMEEFCRKNGIKLIEGTPNKDLYTISFQRHHGELGEKDNSAKDSQKE